MPLLIDLPNQIDLPNVFVGIFEWADTSIPTEKQGETYQKKIQTPKLTFS